VTGLILNRWTSRSADDSADDDYDVLKNDAVVGHIFFVPAALERRRWMWTLTYDHHEDRTPTHGYESTREAAMANLVVVRNRIAFED
jgi:hypothetical protein